MKLTPAQSRTLKKMHEDGAFRCIETYKPMVLLVAYGLAYVHFHAKYGSHTYRCTVLGADLAKTL